MLRVLTMQVLTMRVELCRACKHEHSPLMACSVARRLRESSAKAAPAVQAPRLVPTVSAVDPQPVKARKPDKRQRKGDRHKPGYMAELMRKRRAQAA